MPSRTPPVRGPLPPGVYRRRRIMVAATAVLLVVAGIDLAHDDAAPRVDTAQQVSGTPSAAPTSGTVVIGPRKGRGRHRKRQPTAPVSTPALPPPPPPAQPTGICDDADVVVSPVMTPAVAGKPVLVTLLLRTREAEACTWTISSEHLAYKITEDGEDVWSSSHCPGQVPQDIVVIRRALTGSYRLAWNGRLSSRDCPVAMRHAEPGDYSVQASAIGGEPSGVVPFTLTDPADVAPAVPAGPPVPKGAGTGKGRGAGAGKGSGRKNRARRD